VRTFELIGPNASMKFRAATADGEKNCLAHLGCRVHDEQRRAGFARVRQGALTFAARQTDASALADAAGTAVTPVAKTS